jgi:single-stranded-DNA-specific exonuclease
MLCDMPKAVHRLTHAIDKGEKIAVYGDYDVDGITSTCLVTDYLRSRGADCLPYIPDRMEEGYGVNTGAIESLCRQGVKLIVTVDCGVTALEEADFAASLGVDMIITDHHECLDTLPAAVAVVDPKRPDSPYPGRELAGVGVAFKLLCAMEGSAARPLEDYSDLVAVGTIADVMPIVGENRYIIKAGLEKLSKSPRPGLRALLDESGLTGKRVTATNVGFTLAPRLNAAGRLGMAGLAEDLLLSQSGAEAAEMAAHLCQLNRDRQAIELDIWNQAVAMIGDERPTGPIVLAGENWHQGVIGIAASRLAEAYNVPAVMICLDGENGKGSCRSYGGFNLFQALSDSAQYLDSFGGHALAAGLTIKRKNVDAFRRHLEEYYTAHPASGESVLEIDALVTSPNLLDMGCVEDLERMEPCGSGNPSPQVCLCGATLESVTPIGGGRHVRLRLSKFDSSWDAVFFSKSANELGVRAGDYVDAAFQPQINEFRSRRSVQLLMTDLREHDLSAAKAVLEGKMPQAGTVPAPTREDCALVWRALSRRGSVRAPLRQILEIIAPGMWDVTVCLCLKVFEELGLADLTFDGENLSIGARPWGEKVNLSSSRILRELDCQGGHNEDL